MAGSPQQTCATYLDEVKAKAMSANATGRRAAAPIVSVVIPVFRSEDCLEPLIYAIHKVYPPGEGILEVILVNDCSPDGSWEVIERLCQIYPHIIGIDLRRNFGQNNAILVGLRHARVRYLAIMDDDLQHSPDDLPALFAALDDGADVAYAAFGVKHQKLWKN